MFTVIIIAFPAARDLEVELNILMYTFYIFWDTKYFVKIATYPYGKLEMFNVIIIAFSAARDFEVELNILMYAFYIFWDTK
jgi:hypothetical protein